VWGWNRKGKSEIKWNEQCGEGKEQVEFFGRKLRGKEELDYVGERHRKRGEEGNGSKREGNNRLDLQQSPMLGNSRT